MDVTLPIEMATGECNIKNYILLIGLVLVTVVIKVTGVRTKKFIEPKFRDVGSNVTVHRGETAVLKCLVDNLGPKTVVWRKESKDYILSVGEMMYAPNEEMSIDYRKFPNDRTQWDLIIKKAEPYHSGTYECQISAAKVYTYHVTLNVLQYTAKYSAAMEIYGTEYVSKFSRVNLTCNATGAVRAPVDVDWFHNGQKIYTQDAKWQERLTITNYQPQIPGRSLISQLLIDRSRNSDSGTYICRSSDLNTRSIMVYVLNAEKEIIKREDGTVEQGVSQSVRDSSTMPQTSVASITCLYVLTIIFIYR